MKLIYKAGGRCRLLSWDDLRQLFNLLVRIECIGQVIYKFDDEREILTAPRAKSCPRCGELIVPSWEHSCGYVHPRFKTPLTNRTTPINPDNGYSSSSETTPSTSSIPSSDVETSPLAGISTTVSSDIDNDQLPGNTFGQNQNKTVENNDDLSNLMSFPSTSPIVNKDQNKTTKANDDFSNMVNQDQNKIEPDDFSDLMISSTDTDTNVMDFSVLPNLPTSADPQSEHLNSTPQTIDDVPNAGNTSDFTQLLDKDIKDILNEENFSQLFDDIDM